MNSNRQMSVDRIVKDVRWKGERPRMEWQWTSDEIMTNVRWNEWTDNDCDSDNRWLQWWQWRLQWWGPMTMMTTTDDFISNNAKERSASANFVVMVCRRGDNFIFLLLRVFYLNFLLFPKLLHELLTTWLQVQKHIRVHNPDANLKTHVQGK